MAVKESSDELNSDVAGAFEAGAARARSASDYLALVVATCGVGYLPLAPGTWGSLAGLGVYLLARMAGFRLARALSHVDTVDARVVESLYTTLMLALVLIITLAGVWAATRVEKILARKDPGIVVVDEVAGQLLSFIFVPLSLSLNWWTIVAGFLLFRLFDIWKPYPARRLEALESGLGIMADDCVAGAYAALCLSLLVSISLLP